MRGRERLTGERHKTVILGLETPLEHADLLLQRERLGRVLQGDDGLVVEDLLVHVGVGLQLDALCVAVVDAQLHASQLFVCDAELDQTVDFQVLETTVTASGQADLLFHTHVYTGACIFGTMEMRGNCVNDGQIVILTSPD